jgi:CRP-like cAMP-binding protein
VNDQDGQMLLVGNVFTAGKVMPASRNAINATISNSINTSSMLVFKHFQVLGTVTTTFWSTAWPFNFKELSVVLTICNLDVFGILQGLDSPNMCSLTLPFLDLFRYHMLMPVIIVGSALLANVISWPWFRSRLGKRARYNMFWEFVNTVIFFMYPGLAQRVFQVFQCEVSSYHPEPPVMFMAHDPKVLCDSPEHKSGVVMAIMCLFGYIIGIPVIMFFILCSNRKVIRDKNHVGHENMKKRFGALFRLYEPEFYYWEIGETVVKGFMTGALVIIKPGSTAQYFAGIFVALFHMVAVFKASPYKRDADDWLHFVCGVALVSSLFCGLYLHSENSSGLKGHGMVAIDAVLILMFIVVLISYVIAILLAIPSWRKCCCGRKCEGHNDGEAQALGSENSRISPTLTEEGPEGPKQELSMAVTSNVKIMPQGVRPRHMMRVQSHIEAVQNEYHSGQALLEKVHKKQKRGSQIRLNARLLIRQSNILQKVPVFSGIPEENFPKIVEAMTYNTYPPGTILLGQGEVADQFHILVSGLCYVTVIPPKQHGDAPKITKPNDIAPGSGPDPLGPPAMVSTISHQEIRVGTLKPMQYFGESACSKMNDKPRLRNATVRASTDTPVSTMSLSRPRFIRLVESGIFNSEMLSTLHEEGDARHASNMASLSSVKTLPAPEGE